MPPARLARAALLVGGVLSGAVARAGLPEPVVAALAREGHPAGSLSVYVQAVDAEEPLLVHHADVPRNPASAMKLVTTLAGLQILGPTFTWKTEARVGGRLAGGRLEGNLYLRGGGDPYLTFERFWMLLRDVREAGVREVTGDLVIDNGYFEVKQTDPGRFDGKPHRAYNVVPSALLVSFQATRITVEPRALNAPVDVRIEPPLANLSLHNDLRAVRGRCRGRLPVRLDVIDRHTPEIRLSGTLPDECSSYSVLRAVAAQPAYVRGLFESLWSELGGRLSGTTRLGTAPPDTRRVAQAESPPLAEVIRQMNKFSNNVMTRQLLLTIGAQEGGVPGTLAKGRAAVEAWVTREGLASKGFHIDNGAGLSRSARITARQLGRMLVAAYRGPLMPEFVSTLPILALEGSVRERMKDHRMAGRAHLKTGLLDDVRAIAGYVHAPGGRHWVIVVMQNHAGVDHGGGTRVQDAFLDWLSGEIQTSATPAYAASRSTAAR